MKKFMRCALLFSLTVLLCTACAKEKQNELLQTEHIPGKEEAVVHTPTPIPSPTESASPTATSTPTLPPQEGELVTQATPLPEFVTPSPTLPVEEPDFMDMYRAMPAGTRVDAEGIPEEEIRFCFCKTEITDRIKTAFSDLMGPAWTNVHTLDGIRVLCYRNDGRLYICDVVADTTASDAILNCFYLLYQKGQKIENLNTSLPAELSAQGYRTNAFSVGNVQYVYIYK